MSASEPGVSVVITTIDRPYVVTRAIDSVLRQSLREIEVIVVVDGPDEATLDVLRPIDDHRLRVLALPERVGLGGARNAAVAEVRSRWVAFLDDDDEWLPQKLEIQFETARRSRHRLPIVSCCFIARSEYGDVVFPRRIPRQHEAVSEYLFCQTRPLGGEGIILPSTIFTATDLVRRIPFRYKQLPHEGSDWILRSALHQGVGVEFVPTRDPLAIWHAEETRGRMSGTSDWRPSLAWAETNAHLLTPRARASFILVRVSLEAKRARDWKAFWLLPWAALRRGRPTFNGLFAHALIWLVPEGTRFKIAACLTRWFHSKDAAHES